MFKNKEENPYEPNIDLQVALDKDKVMKQDKMTYNTVKYDKLTGLPMFYSYDCDRCLKAVAVNNYDENDVKELFDYYAITGHKLCPSCRDEFERMKSRAYKVEVTRSYETQMGNMDETDVEYCHDMKEVDAYLDRKNHEIEEKMSLSFIMRNNYIKIEYIPYEKRFFDDEQNL